MISVIYIEKEVKDHPRTIDILKRFPEATQIECDRYGEIFNRKSQNFRLQKKQPALILAKKHQGFVLPAPDEYGISGNNNFYFSHMMNCIYDCRYCFLQGMYRSAHYVLFVNYDDFTNEIEDVANQFPDQETWFYSGYDCDSLALEPITHFAQFILPFFKQHEKIWLELRTKSTQIRNLLDHPPINNCVVAYSLSPDNIDQALEHKTPSLQKRLQAMVKLQEAGWRIAIRFEPLIYMDDFKHHYGQLFDHVFSQLKPASLHSVSYGEFRMPKAFYRNMEKLYPDEKLFSGPLEEKQGMIAYKAEKMSHFTQFCSDQLEKIIPENQLYQCKE